MSQAETAAPQAATTATNESNLDAALHATASRKSLYAAASERMGVEPNKVCPLLRNLWTTSKGQDELTDAELLNGISLIARFGLDPATREIYVTRDNRGRLLTIIGVDGWIKAMLSVPHYDGFETELGWSEDGKRLEWAEVRIFSSKIGRPTVYRGYQVEYGKMAGFVAKDMPWHMLRIFSLRHAIRLFTSLGSNVLMEEEVAYINRHEKDKTPAPSSLDELADRLGEKMEAAGAEAVDLPPPDDEPTTDTSPDDDIDLQIQAIAAEYCEEIEKAKSPQRLTELTEMAKVAPTLQTDQGTEARAGILKGIAAAKRRMTKAAKEPGQDEMFEQGGQPS